MTKEMERTGVGDREKGRSDIRGRRHPEEEIRRRRSDSRKRKRPEGETGRRRSGMEPIDPESGGRKSENHRPTQKGGGGKPTRETHGHRGGEKEEATRQLEVTGRGRDKPRFIAVWTTKTRSEGMRITNDLDKEAEETRTTRAMDREETDSTDQGRRNGKAEKGRRGGSSSREDRIKLPSANITGTPNLA